MTVPEIDVAIVGAGPYGLSLSTQLTARRVEHRIFGRPMHTWASMSPGMYLKSFGWATNIYTPHPHFTLPEYCAARGLETVEPIEIATFARYGVWVQEQLVPSVEPFDVSRLAYHRGRFELELSTGETVWARRVVSAVGLTYFERLPAELTHLPPGVAIHTANESDFTRFRGKRVVVLGGGQSALQAAALLHEAGAETEIFVRNWGVYFSGKMPERRPLKHRILYPNTVLGPGRENWVLQHIPMLMHHLPDEKRVAFTRKHLGPAGAWWLRHRVEGVIPVHPFFRLREAAAEGAGARLCLVGRDGEERIVHADHVIAGTGYDPNLDRISFMDPALREQVERIAGSPRLSRSFEASVPGLHFIGPASAFSFGPLFRFVAGAHYATPLVARHLARTQRTSRAFAALDASMETVSADVPASAIGSQR
jgi:FAD-dependent urate hydroxylase